MKDSLNLGQMEMDALNEMGNIGTGNAATALSKFLNKNIDMNIPETKFIEATDFAKEIGGPEKIVSGIYLKITGDLTGESLFIFPKKGALELIDLAMGKPIGTTKNLSEMDMSAFKEMSNILAGVFLNAISNMLDVQILPSIPHVATDMAQALFDFILIKVAKHAEKLLLIKTKINMEGHNIDGDFIVLFDEESLKKMLDILHKKYGGLYGNE